jgi:hypothetical protein
MSVMKKVVSSASSNAFEVVYAQISSSPQMEKMIYLGDQTSLSTSVTAY